MVDDKNHDFEAAVTAFRRNDIRSAKDAIDSVLNSTHATAEAHLLSGLIEFQLGNSSLGKKRARRALDLDETLTKGYFNLGVMHEQTSEPDAAEECYRKALKLDSENFGSLINLANLLQNQGNYPEALHLLERALDAEPDRAVGFVAHSNALRISGQYKEAKEALERALDLEPDSIEALNNLSALCEEVNDLAASRQFAQRSLEVLEDQPAAELLLARCDRREGKNEAALARLRSLALDQLTIAFQRDAQFEIATVSDALGHFDEAFAAMCKSNALSSAIDQERLALGLSLADEVAGLMEWAQSLPHSLEQTANRVHDGHDDPIFIVGFPRSGTTLLGQIMDAHPTLVMAEERDYFDSVRKQITNAGYRYPQDTFVLPDDLIRKLRSFYFDKFNSEFPLARGQRAVHKFPLDMLHMGLISRLFPNAHVLLAVRHPLDVVLSCFMQRFRLNRFMRSFLTLDGTVDAYREAFRLWDAYTQRLDFDYRVVRYEELVSDFDATVSNLLSWSGLEWSDTVREFSEKAKKRGRIHTPSYSQVSKPIYQSSVQRWRNYETYLSSYGESLEKWIDAFDYS